MIFTLISTLQADAAFDRGAMATIFDVTESKSDAEQVRTTISTYMYKRSRTVNTEVGYNVVVVVASSIFLQSATSCCVVGWC